MCGEQDEFLEAARFPRVEQVIQHPVEGFLSNRCVATETPFAFHIDAELNCGRAQHAVLGGKVVRETLRNDGRGPKREVRPVLLASSHRDDQSRVAGYRRLDLHRDQLLDAKRGVVRERHQGRVGHWSGKRFDV